MSRGKNNNAEDQTLNPNAWMVTFSDLVMLLLTFFVLLLTMSSMDTKQLKDIFIHMKGSAGVLELSGYKSVTNLASFVKKYTNSENDFVVDQSLFQDMLLPVSGLNKETEKMIKDCEGLLEVRDDERGIVFSFQENMLFEAGKAILKEDIFPVLDSISGAIESCPNDILIMGHTDSIPIKSKLYKSNWELSSYRGLAVLEYFLKKI